MRKICCEVCSRITEFRHWPPGWVRSGTSRFGREFDRAGIAWRCSICHVVENLALKYDLPPQEQERIRTAMFQALEHKMKEVKP